MVNIEVDGFIHGSHNLDLEVTFHDNNGILLARHAMGLFTGKYQKFEDEKFHLCSLIELPEGIANGDYQINIDITHPQVQTFAYTRFPIKMNVMGNYTKGGFSINQPFYGFQCLF